MTRKDDPDRRINMTNDFEAIKNDAIMGLLELSGSIDEADSYVIKHSGYTAVKDKLEFVLDLYKDVAIFGGCGNSIETDYKVVLSTIINQKWR